MPVPTGNTAVADASSASKIRGSRTIHAGRVMMGRDMGGDPRCVPVGAYEERRLAGSTTFEDEMDELFVRSAMSECHKLPLGAQEES